MGKYERRKREREAQNNRDTRRKAVERPKKDGGERRVRKVHKKIKRDSARMRGHS